MWLGLLPARGLLTAAAEGRSMRHHRIGVLVMSVFCLALAGVRAQSSVGDIRGVVTDSSGGVMPGVTITLAGAAHTDRTVVTDEKGRFAFLALEPDRYDVTVSMVGFRPITTPVTVTAGATVAFSLRLDVADMSESVTVTAASP